MEMRSVHSLLLKPNYTEGRGEIYTVNKSILMLAVVAKHGENKIAAAL